MLDMAENNRYLISWRTGASPSPESISSEGKGLSHTSKTIQPPFSLQIIAAKSAEKDTILCIISRGRVERDKRIQDGKDEDRKRTLTPTKDGLFTIPLINLSLYPAVELDALGETIRNTIISAFQQCEFELVRGEQVSQVSLIKLEQDTRQINYF